MRVAIIGGRDFGLTLKEQEWMWKKLDILRDQYQETATPWSVVVSGGAKGADTVGKAWAKSRSLSFVLFKPYHLIDTTVSYHPRYFFIRNKQIVDNSDLIVAFWNGESAGTRHAIRYAKSSQKPVVIFDHEPDT
jgi:predicted Rossmann-fold nucleotide-binding protein